MTAHLADALAPILTARERAVLVRPGKTPAAVLVPLLAIDGEPHLLFTRRARGLRELRLVVADPRSRAVRRRVAKQVAGLDPDRERDALNWIESVSEFDADATR